jgi:phytoene synthase
MSDAPSDAEHCADLLHRHELDDWLATLFVPVQHRAAVRALYAFDVELRRVRDVVSEAPPGELRLQWWRDVVDGQERGGAAGHPVAAELLRAIHRYGLPRTPLLALIEARTQDLYDDPPPTMADLEGYFGETTSTLLRLATIVLADGGDFGSPDVAGHGGVARGIMQLLQRLPADRRRGRIGLPLDLLARHDLDHRATLDRNHEPALRAALRELVVSGKDHLARALRLVPDTPREVRPAFLPLALVGPMLARFERAGSVAIEVELPQWRRQWRLWRAARSW